MSDVRIEHSVFSMHQFDMSSFTAHIVRFLNKDYQR